LIHSDTRRAGSAHTRPLVLFVAALTLALAGCGGPNLVPDTPGGIDLNGQWRLNRAASEDPQALITKLQAKVSKRMRGPEDDFYDQLFGDESGGTSGEGRGSGGQGGDSRESGGPGGGPSGGGQSGGGEVHGAGGPGGMRGPSRREVLRTRYTAALGERLSGDTVIIEQSPDRFSITRGDSRRTYTPGGHSVVSVADGVADQTTGWKGREYVIDVRPQVGPHLTERYGLSADGQLVEKVSVREDGLPELEFTRVYERGSPAARLLPTSN